MKVSSYCYMVGVTEMLALIEDDYNRTSNKLNNLQEMTQE